MFAFANDLGSVGSTAVETLYTLVHSQQNAVIFLGAGGLTPVPSLWTSYWDSDLSLVCKLLILYFAPLSFLGLRFL